VVPSPQITVQGQVPATAGEEHSETTERKPSIFESKTRPVEQQGRNQIKIDCRGFKLILINDRDNNFLPVVSFNSSPFVVWSFWNTIVSLIQSKFCLSLNFFNVNIGKWEPFVEKFDFEAVSNQDFQQKEQ
jgi:hypothetical protein